MPSSPVPVNVLGGLVHCLLGSVAAGAVVALLLIVVVRALG